MNFFFFLDHSDKDLYPSIDLFNRPPSNVWSKQKIKNVYVNVFYSNGNKWIFEDLGVLKINEIRTISKKDLPSEFQDQSVFVSLNDKKITNSDLLTDENYLNSIPAWRSNIKINGPFTSSSYQGEMPGMFISKNLSIVSCSPMIQVHDNYTTYFYLINLNANPVKENFEVQITNIKKQVLYKTLFTTNTINVLDLKSTNLSFNEKMYVFKSKNKGGIPLYFTKDEDNKFFSLEHTHPPIEYMVHGNRLYFQKLKKKFWF